MDELRVGEVPEGSTIEIMTKSGSIYRLHAESQPLITSPRHAKGFRITRASETAISSARDGTNITAPDPSHIEFEPAILYTPASETTVIEVGYPIGVWSDPEHPANNGERKFHEFITSKVVTIELVTDQTD